MKYPGVARYSQYGFGFWKDDWMKRKFVKLINAVLDFTPFVPIGWVLTCYDLGIDWISEKPAEGILTLFAATLIASVLWVLGSYAAIGGYERVPEIKNEDMSLWERIRNLLILLAVLLWITIMISHASPPDDVI